MSVFPAYSYTKLDSNPPKIRLVSLQPCGASSQLQCSLMTIPLADAGQYDALSYVWGENTDKLPLMIDRHKLQITRNLDAALRRLQYEHKARVLWVDAICINQDDDEERSSQVRQMRDIYANAEQVVMWLGPESDDSHLFFELFQELRITGMSRSSVLSSLRDIREQEKWMAFVNFCGREYWSRLWIVQEVASTSKNVIYLGSNSVPWEEFGKLVTVITKDLRSFWSSFDFISTSVGGDSTNARLVDIELLYDLHDMSKRGRNINLGELLKKTRRYKCSEPRDKVYGLMGLARDCQRGDFEINYQLPISEVFTNAVRFAMANAGTLNLILEVQYTPSNLDLPSWVPDWTIGTGMAGLSSRLGPHYMASGNKEAAVAYSLDKRLISITGCELGRVDILGVPYTEQRTTLSFTASMKETILQWLSLALDCKLIPPGAETQLWTSGRIDSFWRTLIGNRIKGQAELDVDYCRIMFDVARGAIPCPSATLVMDVDKAFHDFVSPLASEMNGIMYKRRFFTSGREIIGVCPSKAEVGDCIVVLFGCDHPVILRSDDKHWILQGEAYVHGFMNGKVVKLWEPGEVTLKNFTIQ